MRGSRWVVAHETETTLQEAIGSIIDHAWDQIAERIALVADDLELAEMGPMYSSCWVLAVGCSSIGHPEVDHFGIKFSLRGQLPFTTNGLLEDVLARRNG